MLLAPALIRRLLDDPRPQVLLADLDAQLGEEEMKIRVDATGRIPAAGERALAVMRDGGAGPFAVVALVLVLGMQAVSLAELGGAPLTVVLACAAGRAGMVLCCRRGVAAARPEGMGALVAGSQPRWIAGAWWSALALLAVWAGWSAVVGVLVAALLVFGLSWHTDRRLGGVTGDVLGAASELGTTAVLVVSALG